MRSKRRFAMLGRSLCLSVFACIAACASQKNPSFPVTILEAHSEWRELRRDEKELERPLVVAGGYLGSGFTDGHLKIKFREIFDDDRIERVSFVGLSTFEECRERLIAEVDARFPSDDPEWTTEVDVVAFSMGGLVARYASDPGAGARALKIRRLYTISTPFRGARLAKSDSSIGVVASMHPESAFIDELNDPSRVYEHELTPYVRLGDRVVGPENASPPGEHPVWVGNKPMSAAHLWAHRDIRILADIGRRLRSEPPLSVEPRSPLPDG